MRVANGKWFIASRDLYHSSCNHCTLLAMAVAAGSKWAKEKVEPFSDKSEKIQFLQGNQYEVLRFEELKRSLPNGDFIELPKFVDKITSRKTIEAKVPVIAQAYLDVDYGDAMLTGYADLLVREDYDLVLVNGKLQATKLPGTPDSDKYVPYDIKHTTEPKSFYWYQVGAYHEALQQLGIASIRDFGIITKDSILNRPVTETLVEFETSRKPLLYQLAINTPADAETWENLTLHCSNPKTCTDIYCEYPKLCVAENIRLDMFTQLYRNGGNYAAKLQEFGITTVTELSNLDSNLEIPGIPGEKLQQLISEAQVIVNEKNGTTPNVLKKPTASKSIPTPNEGDIFFDLEWFNPIEASKELNYIFGFVDSKANFKYFEAHDLEQEKLAFQDFVNYCLQQIEKYPAMHVYHWSHPEPNGLKKLSEFHGILAKEVDQILNYMVDLLPIAIDLLWVGVGGYSLKQLEHYYQDSTGRVTGTKDGADSLVKYFYYQKAIQDGDIVKAESLRKDIFEYNKADCVSTRSALHWLRRLSQS